MSYKEEFVKFLVRCNALQFGTFTLKSGRVAPYFINTGMFNDGDKIMKLGEYYAAAIREHFGEEFDAVYGPAYKGIPLCVGAAIGLTRLGMTKGYVFNRKEAKQYGQKDMLIGMPVSDKMRLVLIDDVITAGTAIRESLDVLKNNGNPCIKGIIISINRQERGQTEKNALREIAEDLGVPIVAIAALQDVISTLYNKHVDGTIYIDDGVMKKIEDYRGQYGAV